jgi:hypothetical protein
MQPEDVRAATFAVRTAIERTHGPLPPAFVVEFLLRHWRRYLAALHAEVGPCGSEWEGALAAMDRLLWSVAPKLSGDDRLRLIKHLKTVLEPLRAGLAAIGVDPATLEPFFRELSEQHLVLINPSPAAVEAANALPESARRVPDASDTIQMNVLDPRYQKILDLLDNADVEKIEM